MSNSIRFALFALSFVFVAILILYFFNPAEAIVLVGAMSILSVIAIFYCNLLYL